MSCVDKLCLDTKCGPSRLNTIYQHNSWDHNSRLNTTYLNTIYLNTIYQHNSARREVWSFVCAKVCAVLCGVMRCYAVTWLIRMCDMTHSYVWHDAFICVTWQRSALCYAVLCGVMRVMRVSHVRHMMSQVTRMNKSCPTSEWVMCHV